MTAVTYTSDDMKLAVAYAVIDFCRATPLKQAELKLQYLSRIEAAQAVLPLLKQSWQDDPRYDMTLGYNPVESL